nr:hypothetical protein [Microlunatus flavus]
MTLSILGMEDVPGYGYYRAKLVQEQTMLAGPVGATVLRASQFFEFAAQMIALTRRGRFAVVPQMRSQPVAARTVARHLVRLAVEQPGGRHELAGPEVHEIPDVARRIAVARGERLHVVGVPFPGRAGRAMRNGALLARAGTEIDGPTLEDWLSAVWQKPDGGPDR